MIPHSNNIENHVSMIDAPHHFHVHHLVPDTMTHLRVPEQPLTDLPASATHLYVPAVTVRGILLNDQPSYIILL